MLDSISTFPGLLSLIGIYSKQLNTNDVYAIKNVTNERCVEMTK